MLKAKNGSKLFARNGRLLFWLSIGLLGAIAALAYPHRVLDRDCADFHSQAEAQAFFLSQGPGDPHGLDADHDGIACEWNR